MSERTPDFSALVGEDLSPDERERLERVHSLVAAAGPIPELPLALQNPPVIEDRHDASAAFAFLPRRGGRMFSLAAGFALLTLVVGYVVGTQRAGFDTNYTVVMKGTPAAPVASVVLRVGEVDAVGNRPLELEVAGLRPQPEGAYYMLYLTKRKKPAVLCGTFRVHGGTTTVRMTVPFEFRSYDGWIVTEHRPGERKPSPPLVAKYFT